MEKLIRGFFTELQGLQEKVKTLFKHVFKPCSLRINWIFLEENELSGNKLKKKPFFFSLCTFFVFLTNR